MSFEIAVNTSQSNAQLLFFNESEIIENCRWEKMGSHSEIITGQFQDSLEKNNLKISDLKKINCVLGPGSFTGVRVAINFCKTLSYSQSIDLSGINSLDLFALQCNTNLNRVYSLIDAQKNSVFFSSYDLKEGKLIPDQQNLVIPVSKLNQWMITPGAICGNAHPKYIEVSQAKDQFNHQLDTAWTKMDLKVIFDHRDFIKDYKNWSELQPLYIKGSAPEEKINPSDVT